jgi:transposase
MRAKRFTLSRSQRDDLERRYKQTRERLLSDRIQAILLLDAGHNREQVARILRLNPKTITRWIDIYVEAGIDTLCTLPAGNTSAALTQDQQKQLRVWLDADVRTTKEAIDWVEQTFEVAYSESGMRKLLLRLNYRFKQPSVIPAKADTEAQTAWLEQFQEKRGP